MMDPAAAEPEDALPAYLTVRELAELLRIKERKVYDLAASGEVPCARVTGKLLFPASEVREWIARGSRGAAAAAARPGVFLGSHDPLLEWALRQSQAGLATYFDGSLDGLTRFCAGEGVATGLHVHEPGGGWNVATVSTRCAGENAVLVGWAVRRRGLAVRAGDSTRISGAADLRGRRVAPRQAESGAQALFREVLGKAGVAFDEIDLAETARSEGDAVLAVAEGAADAAFGLEALARLHGLHFIPLVDERFDLLVDRRAWFEPPMQRLFDFCAGAAFRERAAAFAGYDVSELGAVRWNA